VEHANHKHPRVERWLSRSPCLHMHFRSTGCSSLIMVERLLPDLTGNRLSRGVFSSVEELIIAAGEYLTTITTKSQALYFDCLGLRHPV
jgi:hypothetical protein